LASAVPAVSIIQWDEVPDFRALLTLAQGTDAEVIYLAPSDVRRDASPLKQVEAVAEFTDPRVVLAVVGEGPPMLIWKSFILSASATLRPQTDIADVGQDLLDFANRSGYAARFI